MRAGQKEPVPATLADHGSGPRRTDAPAGAGRLGFWTPHAAIPPKQTAT
jgi:hypothetical protein